MDALTLFGAIAVSLMLVFYALEDRSAWFVLAFACACALSAVYGYLQGAWPFAIVEAVWAAVALMRWRKRIVGVHAAAGLIAAGLITPALADPTTAAEVYVVTYVDALPDGAGKVATVLASEVSALRQDQGCIRAEAVRQIDRANHFTLLTVWKDRKAFDDAVASAHARDFRAALQPLLGSPFDERLHVLIPVR